MDKGPTDDRCRALRAWESLTVTSLRMTFFFEGEEGIGLASLVLS